MSFYIDKESVFLTLKITFLWRKVFVYKVQQCIKQHITNKMNNYQCKQFSMQQCLLCSCLWEMKNHVELISQEMDPMYPTVSDSVETLFLSFMKSKAQVKDERN